MNEREIWLDPTPVQTTSAHLNRIKRLSAVSAAKYHDSESEIDWTPDHAGKFLKIEESLALYGTPYWERLDGAAQRRLAYLEVIASWHAFVAIETFAVTLQSNIVLNEYTARAKGIPEEVTEYWIHFCKEELVHTLMFRRAMRHFDAPKFPDDVSKARLIFGGLNWVSVATLALLFEWFQEELQWETSRAAHIEPVTRQIVTSHHVEEARHIRFGREVVAAFWRSQPAAEREKVLPLIVAAIRTSVDDLTAHAEVLKAMNFTDPDLQDVRALITEIMRCEYRIEYNKKIWGRLFSFIRDVDIYNRTTAPTFALGGIDHYFSTLN